MIPSFNSATSVKQSQDTAFSVMERHEDEGSEDLSNAELYLKRCKKRGLYVETETTETTGGGNVTDHLKRLLPTKTQPQRFLPRDHSPLPGRSDSKPFVWSVLDDSTPATSESDIHEANKQIRNTIQEIQDAIKDINFGSNKKLKEDSVKKKSKFDTAKKVNDDSEVSIDVRSKDTHKSKSERSRGSAHAKDILEIRKKELTLTMRTVVKEPPNNRFSYRFVHEEDNSNTESNLVKIRKRTASNDTNKSEAKRRTGSKTIPDPIQISYNTDEIKKTENQSKCKYINDLNSNRESIFYFLGSDADSRKEHEKSRHIGSYINGTPSSSKNLVVIQPTKELNITSQSQISDSEELEVLDIDLNATSNDSMSCTKTLMGNNFYTNNNDRSKVLRKQETNTYSSDDNEVFGIYSNYNDEETVKSVGSLEMPFLYDSVEEINRKEHGYDLARYLLDEKTANHANYSADERYRVNDEYKKRSFTQQKRVHIAPKTIPPVTTNYPRRNKKQRRSMKSFANAEKRRRFIEKEKLLNLIKQQLSMDYINMEPPRSVFEELKEMARNKRRRHKRVSFSTDVEHYERRMRKIPEKRTQPNQRHVKRFKKNPQSIIRQNNEIYKDIEFFNKVASMNKRVRKQKTKIMSPGYVNRKINEIHEQLSDNEDDYELEVDEDASLEVIDI